jgi:hypothetical protein
MKRVFSSIVLLLAFSFLLVSNAKAGEREDNLVMLAMSGSVDGVRDLLDQGVDINAKNSTNGCTALANATMVYGLIPGGNYIAVVQLLLARGADINAICLHTPLGNMVLHGNVDVVRILIDKGADVNKKDDSGNTPLMLVKAKLEGGEFKGIEKGTDNMLHITYRPLTPAESETYTKIVQMLQAAGAK